MGLKRLIETWEQSASEQRTAQSYSVNLPVYDAARIAALAELFPGRTETQIITDLLSAALDEVEESIPYIQGEQVVAEDEYGDPIYEDAGLTPRFHALAKEYARRLEAEGEESGN